MEVTALQVLFIICEHAHACVDEIKNRLARDFQIMAVESVDACDVAMVFCINVSRLGTDIESILQRVPGKKPTILVVLHHTFDHDYVIPSSRAFVQGRDIIVIDTLFYEDQGLLKCDRNNIALETMSAHLHRYGHKLHSPYESHVDGPFGTSASMKEWLRTPYARVLLVVIVLLLVVGVAVMAVQVVAGCVLLAVAVAGGAFFVFKSPLGKRANKIG
ncbi:uncharacterized protein LOC114803404 [Denticeps clupeoides]|uniref:uncharacterized protein LOC114803404 n=1 Tax=Denticeps clupeoides TaxID=299321 RepID=UPI0010A5531F|nr:uncharacterized protein LOC114803404 [Denticeps clupeoides]